MDYRSALNSRVTSRYQRTCRLNTQQKNTGPERDAREQFKFHVVRILAGVLIDLIRNQIYYERAKRVSFM